MLENHADAQCARTRRARDRHRVAVPAYGSSVWPDYAVDDFHQRRFAGAILAQDRVDLSGHDAEVDRVVGYDRWIDLGDALELEPRGRQFVAGGWVHARARLLCSRGTASARNCP